MATKTKEKEIMRIPGTKQLQSFLRLNSKLFNFSEMERACDFPSGTLRYICAEKSVAREMTNAQYKKVQEIVLPKLCEIVFLLQNYDVSSVREWDY